MTSRTLFIAGVISVSWAFHTPSAIAQERPERPLQRIPDFAIVSLDDSAQLITNASLAGHVVLIDFWATWCPPCVDEIPMLTDAYQRFHGRGFTILSLSFDTKPEQVRRFREKRYPMPWLHAIVERGFGSWLSQAFGVENIPRQILIGPDGSILASDDALRGKRLAPTLERYFP